MSGIARSTPGPEAPLLDRAELAALIAEGARLARHLPPQRSDSGRHGGEAARRLGEGMDFAEHRPYLPGDDPRRINWRLTARHGKPHVRRYHEDVTAPCVLLLDRRGPMRFGTRRRLKVTQAVRLAVVLAGLYTARQASVTVLALDRHAHLHPATTTGLLPLAQHLAAPCPPVADGGFPLAQALELLQRQVQPGARLIVLSDFADGDAIDTPHWHQLARRYRIDGVCIEDPAEIDLGPLNDGASLCWRSDQALHLKPAVARDMAARHASRLATLEQNLNTVGIGLWRLSSTEDDLFQTVQALWR